MRIRYKFCRWILNVSKILDLIYIFGEQLVSLTFTIDYRKKHSSKIETILDAVCILQIYTIAFLKIVLLTFLKIVLPAFLKEILLPNCITLILYHIYMRSLCNSFLSFVSQRMIQESEALPEDEARDRP